MLSKWTPIIITWTRSYKGTNIRCEAASHLTTWSSVIFEKLTVAQIITKLPPFMEPYDSLPCSEEPATGPYPEPHDSSQRSYTVPLRSILILSSHLYLHLLISLFLSDFSIKILCALMIASVHATCPAQLILLDLIIRVRVMKLLIMQFSPASCYFICLRSKYSLQYPILKHP
jgi:hypothetical protein